MSKKSVISLADQQTLASQEQAWVLAKSRAELCSIMLMDAQRTVNSLGTRYTCAFDALYLCTLAALQAPAGLQSHPDMKLLLEGAQLLGLTALDLAPALERANRLFGPLEASEDEVSALIALATKARESLRLPLEPT